MYRINFSLLLAIISSITWGQSPLHGTYVMQIVPNSNWWDEPTVAEFETEYGLYSIGDTPYLGSSSSSPLDELVEAGIIEKPRLFHVYGTTTDTSRFQVLEYVPFTSTAYAFNSFVYHASVCEEADYYRMKVEPEHIDSIVAITQLRPNYDEEIWYYDISGLGNFSNQSCVHFDNLNNDPMVTMEGFAQFTANIVGQEYFPWIVEAPTTVRDWSYPSSSFAGMTLSQFAPSTSCTGNYEPNNFWTCEVQMVGCPDLNGDDYVDMDDLLEFLPVYDTPVNCDDSTPEE